MADIRNEFAGIRSPNPFWLASAPPTDKAYNVTRAFKAGWGGVVWKTLGLDPHIVNVNGPRYGVIHGADRRVLGINNIELITDRPLQTNLNEIKQVKRDWPDRAMVVSLMVPCDEESWTSILPLVEETGADGIELNFGCPHGMSERGMGSAVGQVPEYIEMVTRWCKASTRMPVIVKLTPNITDIRYPARAAHAGGADAVSLINTVSSITSVNLDSFSPEPSIDGKGSHGGYCGPAVKPIALNMVAEIARDAETPGLPISGIGGITTWRDAAEFLALGAGNVQVCTAAMTYGFRIIEELCSGLSAWMDEKGHASLADFQGRAVPNVTDWQYLNLNYVTKARIDQEACISCGRCYAACEDTSHQAISMSPERVFEVIDEECVACNLCVNVCPVENCITMERLPAGTVDPRTGRTIGDGHSDWTSHPNNPSSIAAEQGAARRVRTPRFAPRMTSARIIASRADLDEGAAHLVALDPRFGQALEIAGPPPLRRRPPGFAALFQVLVGQQVSVAAAAGIWQRIEEAGVVTPGAVLARDDEALRALGLSRPKVRYARAIAGAIESGSLCLDTCAALPVDEAISSLTQVKGIGPWTAEIYLMFCVGHADVFASKDLALQEAARLLFGLDARPTHVEMAAMAEAWTPWRAVAARILWSYYRAAKGREGVAG